MPRPTQWSAVQCDPRPSKAPHQPGLCDTDSLKPASVPECAPSPPPSQEAGLTIRYRGSLFIMQKSYKSLLDCFEICKTTCKKCSHSFARSSCVCGSPGHRLHGPGCGSVCVLKKASPWHPEGHHRGPGVSKNESASEVRSTNGARETSFCKRAGLTPGSSCHSSPGQVPKSLSIRLP